MFTFLLYGGGGGGALAGGGATSPPIGTASNVISESSTGMSTVVDTLSLTALTSTGAEAFS